MNSKTRLLPDWSKQMVVAVSLLLALPGILLGFGFLCLTLLLVIDNESEAVSVGLIGSVLTALTLGAGGAIFWHSVSSLQENRSKPLRFPPTLGMIGFFALYIGLGVLIFQNAIIAGLFFPPTILVAATIPSLLTVSSFMNRPVDGVTWRRGVVAFAGSALMSLSLIIVVQMLILIAISFLTPYPGKTIIRSLSEFENIVGGNITRTVVSRDFLLIFAQISIIVPITGTLTKPLVTLPLAGYLSKRDLFFIGAIAGASFATLESVVFISLWPRYWAWLLIMLTLGAAIHPFGAGLLALGWKDILEKIPNSWSKWVAGFGVATTLHALWNTGLLFMLSVSAGSDLKMLFGQETMIVGAIVIFLTGSGLIAYWAGRSITEHINIGSFNDKSGGNWYSSSRQAIAIWAFASSLAIVPIGIIVLQLLLR